MTKLDFSPEHDLTNGLVDCFLEGCGEGIKELYNIMIPMLAGHRGYHVPTNLDL